MIWYASHRELFLFFSSHLSGTSSSCCHLCGLLKWESNLVFMFQTAGVTLLQTPHIYVYIALHCTLWQWYTYKFWQHVRGKKKKTDQIQYTGWFLLTSVLLLVDMTLFFSYISGGVSQHTVCCAVLIALLFPAAVGNANWMVDEEGWHLWGEGLDRTRGSFICSNQWLGTFKAIGLAAVYYVSGVFQ